jgi:hypothetical protein
MFGLRTLLLSSNTHSFNVKVKLNLSLCLIKQESKECYARVEISLTGNKHEILYITDRSLYNQIWSPPYFCLTTHTWCLKKTPQACCKLQFNKRKVTLVHNQGLCFGSDVLAVVAMSYLWHGIPRSSVEDHRGFRGIYCFILNVEWYDNQETNRSPVAIACFLTGFIAILNMEAVQSSETSVNFYWITRATSKKKVLFKAHTNSVSSRYYFYSSIPVTPTWSTEHPWNASFHFSFLI